MKIDIDKLIEAAEKIMTDDQIGFAEKITKPIQETKDNIGNVYQLQVVLTSNVDEIIDWHEDVKAP